MNRVIVGLGSNIDPEKNIPEARKILAKNYRVVAESSFTITQPVGAAQQSEFLNGAVLLETKLSSAQLKEDFRKIESNLGRTKSLDLFAPRTIDLDIVVWNGTIIDQDFYNRDYLRRSVLELAPDLKY